MLVRKTKLLLLDIKKEGFMDMQSFCLQQLFIAGLKDEIRAKVMEACKMKACEYL